MAKVLLTSAAPTEAKNGQLELEIMLESVQHDKYKSHVLTDDPTDASLVLFVEREGAAGDALEAVRQHPLVSRFPEKCFVFNPRYKGMPLLPGIYASVPKRWYNPSRIRSGHYPEVCESNLLRYDASYSPEYLFSFLGMIWTSPVRYGIFGLKDYPRGLVQDTSDDGVKPYRAELWGEDVDERRKEWYKQRYADSILNSKFVLCPRGMGPSSMRLFETMLLGRVPVILSDQWVPPVGPEWDTFSIRVAERDVRKIPSLLEAHEDRAVHMGRAARSAWSAWFARDVTFKRVVDSCLNIQSNRRVPETLLRPLIPIRLLAPSYIYQQHGDWLRHRIDAVRAKVYKMRSPNVNADVRP
jgi:hypothetical protein